MNKEVSQAQPAAGFAMPPVYAYRRAGATYMTLVDPRPFKNTDSAPIEWFAVYEPAQPAAEPVAYLHLSEYGHVYAVAHQAALSRIGLDMTKPLPLFLAATPQQPAAASAGASDERALFESWAAAGNMHTGTLDHVGAYVPGTYADARLHTGWLAWQARAALQSAATK